MAVPTLSGESEIAIKAEHRISNIHSSETQKKTVRKIPNIKTGPPCKEEWRKKLSPTLIFRKSKSENSRKVITVLEREMLFRDEETIIYSPKIRKGQAQRWTLAEDGGCSNRGMER